jgi:hypothetical protein
MPWKAQWQGAAALAHTRLRRFMRHALFRGSEERAGSIVDPCAIVKLKHGRWMVTSSCVVPALSLRAVGVIAGPYVTAVCDG